MQGRAVAVVEGVNAVVGARANPGNCIPADLNDAVRAVLRVDVDGGAGRGDTALAHVRVVVNAALKHRVFDAEDVNGTPALAVELRVGVEVEVHLLRVLRGGVHGSPDSRRPLIEGAVVH